MMYTDNNDYFWERALLRDLRFVWWPKHCYVSGKLIWLSFAYRFRRIITGPGEPVIEDRWITKVEGIIKLLKG